MDSKDFLAKVSPALRSAYVHAISEIEKLSVDTQDSIQFCECIVEIIQRAFDLYAVGFFVVDDSKEWLVLKAGVGGFLPDAIQHGHKLALNGNSMVAMTAQSGNPRLALDRLNQPEIRYPSAILPPVHSELSTPLLSKHNKVVLGVLDFQSVEYNALDIEDFIVFSSLANYVVQHLEKMQ